MFAASYLTEAAASWFQPFLLALVCQVSSLTGLSLFPNSPQMFGDPHLASTSEWKLQTLCMRDNTMLTVTLLTSMSICRYGWNDTALAHAFYNAFLTTSG